MRGWRQAYGRSAGRYQPRCGPTSWQALMYAQSTRPAPPLVPTLSTQTRKGKSGFLALLKHTVAATNMCCIHSLVFSVDPRDACRRSWSLQFQSFNCLSLISNLQKSFQLSAPHSTCVSTVCLEGQGTQAPVDWLARHMGSLPREMVACSGGERAL